jgi:hypothetical protein
VDLFMVDRLTVVEEVLWASQQEVTGEDPFTVNRLVLPFVHNVPATTTALRSRHRRSMHMISLALRRAANRRPVKLVTALEQDDGHDSVLRLHRAWTGVV